MNRGKHLKRTMRFLETEKTGDCRTCRNRHTANLEMLQETKCKTLGIAWCHECSRSFIVIVPDEV